MLLCLPCKGFFVELASVFSRLQKRFTRLHRDLRELLVSAGFLTKYIVLQP